MSAHKVVLCLGSSCHSRGNRRRVEALALHFQAGGDDSVRLEGSLCLGRCAEGPIVLVDGEVVALAPDDDVVSVIEAKVNPRVVP